MTAAHNIVTIFCESIASMMEAGTNTMTSLNKARIVDFMLLPIDCRMIAADLI